MVDLPDFGITGLNLSPEQGVSFKRSEGGLVITSRRFDPYWRGSLETRPLQNWADSNELSSCLAFLSKCIDLNLRVTFIHPRRTLPQSYTVSSWPLIGDAELLSTPDLRTLRIRDLPSGTQLLRGDVLEVIQGDISIYRWISEDILTTSIISQNIPITPRLPIGVLTPASLVRFKNARLKMMIVPDSVSHDETAEGTRVTFEVEESLR